MSLPAKNSRQMSNTIPPLKFFPWSEINENLYNEREESSFVEGQRKDLDLDWFTPFLIVFTIVVVEIARKTMRKGKEWFKYPNKILISWQLAN